VIELNQYPLLLFAISVLVLWFPAWLGVFFLKRTSP
jgi:hypothetical protein